MVSNELSRFCCNAITINNLTGFVCIKQSHLYMRTHLSNISHSNMFIFLLREKKTNNLKTWSIIHIITAANYSTLSKFDFLKFKFLKQKIHAKTTHHNWQLYRISVNITRNLHQSETKQDTLLCLQFFAIAEQPTNTHLHRSNADDQLIPIWIAQQNDEETMSNYKEIGNTLETINGIPFGLP